MKAIPTFKIVNYKKAFAPYFYNLNIAWLEKYFYVEDYDREVLSNPEHYILDKGGTILFALLDDKVGQMIGISLLSSQK